jgi:hypothetical protein
MAESSGRKRLLEEAQRLEKEAELKIPWPRHPYALAELALGCQFYGL